MHLSIGIIDNAYNYLRNFIQTYLSNHVYTKSKN